MLRPVQAAKGDRGPIVTRRAPAVVAFCAAGLLSACAGGVDLRKVEIDRSIVTSAVAPPARPEDPAESADKMTIRNAVTSIDLEELDGDHFPWANPGTGSRGEISGIAEYRQEGTLCRRFTALRESFEGVRLYNGDVCLHDNGLWSTRSFQAS